MHLLTLLSKDCFIVTSCKRAMPHAQRSGRLQVAHCATLILAISNHTHYPSMYIRLQKHPLTERLQCLLAHADTKSLLLLCSIMLQQHYSSVFLRRFTLCCSSVAHASAACWVQVCVALRMVASGSAT